MGSHFLWVILYFEGIVLTVYLIAIIAAVLKAFDASYYIDYVLVLVKHY